MEEKERERTDECYLLSSRGHIQQRFHLGRQLFGIWVSNKALRGWDMSIRGPSWGTACLPSYHSKEASDPILHATQLTTQQIHPDPESRTGKATLSLVSRTIAHLPGKWERGNRWKQKVRARVLESTKPVVWLWASYFASLSPGNLSSYCINTTRKSSYMLAVLPPVSKCVTRVAFGTKKTWVIWPPYASESPL